MKPNYNLWFTDLPTDA